MSKFTDIMPTLVDVAGATYPDTYKGDSVVTMQGRSLLPIFKGRPRQRKGPIFNKWREGRSIYRDGWKLVQQGEREWELYNLRTDRTETTNRAEARPTLVEDLADRWETWYDRTGQYRTPEE